VVGDARLDGGARHLGRLGLAGILDDGHAASGANGGEAGSAVVEATGHQHADGAPRIAGRRRAEQPVDRRPGPVFARAVDHQEPLAVDQEVSLGGRDVDVAALGDEPVLGPRHRERPRAAKDVGEVALGRRREVLHDEDGSGDVGAELA
jgi:hypothetical protein